MWLHLRLVVAARCGTGALTTLMSALMAAAALRTSAVVTALVPIAGTNEWTAAAVTRASGAAITLGLAAFVVAMLGLAALERTAFRAATFMTATLRTRRTGSACARKELHAADAATLGSLRTATVAVTTFAAATLMTTLGARTTIGVEARTLSARTAMLAAVATATFTVRPELRTATTIRAFATAFETLAALRPGRTLVPHGFCSDGIPRRPVTLLSACRAIGMACGMIRTITARTALAVTRRRARSTMSTTRTLAAMLSAILAEA